MKSRSKALLSFWSKFLSEYKVSKIAPIAPEVYESYNWIPDVTN